MTNREVMQMALDQITECLYDHGNGKYKGAVSAIQRNTALNNIELLRAALAQPTTHRWNIERDGDSLLVCDGEHGKIEPCQFTRYVKVDENVAIEQPEQEPVAWMRQLDVYYMKQDGIRAAEVESVKSEKHSVPLYTKEPT